MKPASGSCSPLGRSTSGRPSWLLWLFLLCLTNLASELRLTCLQGETELQQQQGMSSPLLGNNVSAGRNKQASAGFILFAEAISDANRLYEDLMMTYNKIIRPVRNDTDRVVVRLSLKLSQLMDVNLKNQMMTTNVWLNQEWSDYKLRWDPSEYGGIRDINVPAEQIWLPDIVLYNSAEGYFAVSIMTKAKVNFDGRVVWNPPAIFRSSCQIDITFFPFDSQNCHLKFGSWTFGTKIDLRHINDTDQIIEPGTDLSEYYQNVEWDIMQVTAKRNIITYTCCPNDFYPDVTFNFTLRRKPLFYTVNLILPCIGITILSFLVFYLPSDDGEKVTLTISILVSLIFFLSVLIETIPSTSLAMPLLGKYLAFTMVLITVSVCATVCVLNIHFRTPSTHSMAPWVKRWCIDILPKYLFMDVPHHQSQQASVLPEQLIYLHNQAYTNRATTTETKQQTTINNSHHSTTLLQQHKAPLSNTQRRDANKNAQVNKFNNHLLAEQQQQQQQQISLTKSSLLSNHSSIDRNNININRLATTTIEMDPSSLESDTIKLMSPSGRFLPYLQSEAARRLQLQRSRSSERETRSGINDFRNCDTGVIKLGQLSSSGGHGCTNRQEAHLLDPKSGSSKSSGGSKFVEVTNKCSKKKKKKKKENSTWRSMFGLTNSKSSPSFVASDKQISSSLQESEQQDEQEQQRQDSSSSTFDNDYQHHNHFQARASICSNNVWRIGPARRCSMAALHAQQQQHGGRQSGLPINTLSGCLDGGHHNHHQHHHNHQLKNLQQQHWNAGAREVSRTALGALVSATGNLAVRSKPELATRQQEELQQLQRAPTTGQRQNHQPTMRRPQHGTIEQTSDRLAATTKQYKPAPGAFVRIPAPPLAPLSSGCEQTTNWPTLMMGRSTSLQRFQMPAALYNSSSQQQQQPHGTGSRPQRTACNYLYSSPSVSMGLYQLGSSNPPIQLNPAQQIHHLATNQQRQPDHMLASPVGSQMHRSRSSEHRLCMYTTNRNNNDLYAPSASNQRNLHLDNSVLQQSANRQSWAKLQQGIDLHPSGSAIMQQQQQQQQQQSLYLQNSRSIGRALGQAYVERLHRQPTIQSLTHRPSRSLQRTGGQLIQKQQQLASGDQTTTSLYDGQNVERMRRSRSQSSLDRKQLRQQQQLQLGSLDCEQCGSSLRLPVSSNHSACKGQAGFSQDVCRPKSVCRVGQRNNNNNSSNNCWPTQSSLEFACDHQHQCQRRPASGLIGRQRHKQAALNALELMKLISDVDKAIQNAMFIAQHIDNLDEFESKETNSSLSNNYLINWKQKVKENWKFIAMVIDRIFLFVFLFACIAGTVTIFAMVPWSYYTIEKPIDLQLTRLRALNLTAGEPYLRGCQEF